MAPDQSQTEVSADLRPFAGQHAVVTGGGRGIGACIAEHLAARGASLTLIGRTPGPVEAQKARLHGLYAVPVEAIAADVTDAEQVAGAFKKSAAALGPVQILINNAGRGESAPIKRMDLAFLRRMADWAEGA